METGAKKLDVGKIKISIAQKIMLLVFISSMITVVVSELSILPKVTSLYRDSICDNMKNLVKAYGSLVEYRLEKNGYSMLLQEELDALFENVQIESVESCYPVFVNSSGLICYYPDASYNSTNYLDQFPEETVVPELMSRIAKSDIPEASVTETVVGGRTMFVAYYVCDGSNPMLLIMADKSEALSVVRPIVIIGILSAAICIVAMLIVSWLLAKTIARPVRVMTDVLKESGELNFSSNTVTGKYESNNDETGAMARAITNFKDNIQSVVKRISQVSNKIHDGSDALENMVGVLEKNSNRNLSTTDQLSNEMKQNVLPSVAMIENNITEITADLAEVNVRLQSGKEKATSVHLQSGEMQESSKAANEKTKYMYEELSRETESAVEKAQKISEISKLAQQISAIASQTNLLSLNASIEAARAGDAGRGFAVVAEEIRQLATQTEQTTGDIKQVVEVIEDAAKGMVECLNKAMDYMDTTVMADYHGFMEAGVNYYNSSADIENIMGEISSSVNKLNEEMVEIKNNINSISGIINTSVDGIGDIENQSSEIFEMVGKTDALSNDMVEYVKELNSIVNQFKL